MKKFSDLNIVVNTPMTGDKIKISKVLNREIILSDYCFSDSKFQKNKSGKCLCLQIVYEGEKRVVFTGSEVLIKQVEQITKNDLPIECTIIQQGEHYEFT